ncbi:uncharacterized protein JN550_002787 [Neoarthrinium moseri]|uniref:uncharacterized protein n=1 Tax=Neoarthrinium moseri TaxID=1658444 RepID=UPI001FDADA50|nr:uncharacterized protein JN550_002787 [Neoarthrinium moseri]KAI1874208.1 hypothetical protein JN550_002787 [Neoarthrinium moseri]
MKMAARTTKQLILANKPAGMPVLSGPDATFKLQTVTLPELKEGEIVNNPDSYLEHNTYLEFYSCARCMPSQTMQANADLSRAQFPMSGSMSHLFTSARREFTFPGLRHSNILNSRAVLTRRSMRSGVIAEVLESKSPKIKAGDMVMDYHRGIWSELLILSDQECQLLAPLPNGLPLTHYLGTFGGSGLTSYTGLLYAGGAKRDSDQTVVVSAAGGATGSMVVQIAAKILKVKRVIGIAGSDEKCEWVKKIGAHDCLNYKSPTFLEDLKAATPDEVDIYYDNVGGAILDAMLPRMKRLGKGTIAVCGAIAQYNADGKPMELHNWCEVFSARINIKGFIMFDFMEHVPAALQELIAAAADGRLDLSDAETVVQGTLEQQPEIWTRLYTGDNKGKLVTKLVA